MEQGILLGMLGLYAVEDIRRRHITLPYLIIFGLLGIFLHMYFKDTSVVSILSGVAVGLGLIVLSVLTRGSIGMGDGFLFLVTGIFLGGGQNISLLMVSLLYAALFSLGVLVLGKRNGKKKEIPFVPFVFLGYATMLLEVVV